MCTELQTVFIDFFEDPLNYILYVSLALNITVIRNRGKKLFEIIENPIKYDGHCISK